MRRDETFLQAIRGALGEAMQRDESVVLCGQLVKYGLGGLTTGLYEERPKQVLTFPVCEALMNGVGLGLALAGRRPVIVHERMDFLTIGMDSLINHAPVLRARIAATGKSLELPLTVIAVVGKGHGQGPQHSKDLTPWFNAMEGWNVVESKSPKEARQNLLSAIFNDAPTLYVARRENFQSSTEHDKIRTPTRVGLCGASSRHEREFYRRK